MNSRPILRLAVVLGFGAWAALPLPASPNFVPVAAGGNNAGPLLLYNCRGADPIARFQAERPAFSGLPSHYARAIFRPLPNDSVFHAVLRVGKFRKLGGVFARENGRVLEVWTVNLQGQNPASVRGRLRSDFPDLFFNLVPYSYEDKLTPKLYGLKSFAPGEQNAQTDKIFAHVYFFPDVTAARQNQILHTYIAPEDFLHSPYTAEIRGTLGQLQALARVDEVSRVTEADTIPKLTSDVSRAAIGVDSVQTIDTAAAAPDTGWLDNPPYADDYFGRGVVVGVYDEGIDTSANDMSPNDFKEQVAATEVRTRRADPDLPWEEGNDPTGFDDWVTVHGNHVAGIIGGNGWNSAASGGTPYLWRGIAPKCLFISQGPFERGFAGDVNNHSHIIDESAPGYYTDADSAVDGVIHNHALTHTMVYAAANNGISGYGAQRGYYSILSNAKNAITVGAVYQDTALRAAFSSMGPTRDGRIKPDVMAPGASYDYPDRSVIPMHVEIDYIRIRRPNNVTAAAWEFNTDGDNEGWTGSNPYYTANEQVAGGMLSFDVKWLGAWLEDTAITGYNSNPNDTLIISYRISHPQIPSKMTRLRVGLSWDTIDYTNDMVRFSLPTPDTVNFQVVKFRLRDLYGFLSPDDATNGWQPWPTQGSLRITKLYLALHSDTLEFITSVNATARNAPRYMQQQGTSMAAPHVTGLVALMLEKWAKVVVPGANLDTQGPWNSTVKAILVHTATDLVNTAPTEWEVPNMPDTWATVNPDLCVPVNGQCTRQTRTQSFVKYYAGPDYATGYGLINAPKALAYTDSNHIVQDSLRRQDGSKTYAFTVPAGVEHFRVSLAWDDLPGDPSLPIDQIKLVNDLDLSVVSPSGRVFYPWVLDSLPQNIVNNQPPADGLDPIDSADIQPAYKGINTHDNVEVVDVDSGGLTLAAGTWQVVVRATQVMAGDKQDFSLVSDYTLGPASVSGQAAGGQSAAPATSAPALSAAPVSALSAPVNTQVTQEPVFATAMGSNPGVVGVTGAASVSAAAIPAPTPMPPIASAGLGPTAPVNPPGPGSQVFAAGAPKSSASTALHRTVWKTPDELFPTHSNGSCDDANKIFSSAGVPGPSALQVCADGPAPSSLCRSPAANSAIPAGTDAGWCD